MDQKRQLTLPLRKAALAFRNYAWAMRHRYLDRFVFIHINKTGGSSIEKAFKLPFEHKTALEKIQELGSEKWNHRFTFTVVRNPWDKVVSHFCFRVKTNQTNLGAHSISFSEWVKRAYGQQDPLYYDKPRMFMPQCNWITDHDGHILVNKVCRFEQLEADLLEICRRLKKKVHLEHLKKSDRGDYRQYYDSESIEIIEKWFLRDIDRFGYEF